MQFEFPNLSLHFLLEEIKPLIDDSILNKVQEINSDLFKFRIHSRKGSINLIVSTNALFLSSYSFPARQQTSGFGAFLNKYLLRKKIISIEQLALERIILMKFNDFNLYFELFGKGNIIFTDKENIILRPLRKESWAARQLKAKEKYLLPPSKGLNPFELTFNELKKILNESNSDVIRTLLKSINLAPIFLEQALIEAQINKNLKANSLNETMTANLFASIKSIISRKPEKAFLVKFNENNVLVPFKVNFNSLNEFNSINSALDEIFFESFSSKTNAIKKNFIEKKLNDLDRKILNLSNALNSLKQKIELNKNKAELIYANFQLIQSIISKLEYLKQKNIPEKQIIELLRKEFPLVKEINFRKKELLLEF